MPRRYFNWKLAIVLVIGLTVLVTTGLLIHYWQKSNSTVRSLTLGTQAYEQQDWEQAAKYFGNYLSIIQDDVPILLKYGESQMNIRPVNNSRIEQAIAAYRKVLRADADNLEAVNKLTELYLTVAMYGDAELIAGNYLENNEDPAIQRLLALAMINQRKFDEAVVELQEICTKYPDHILAYETLGSLVEERPDEFQNEPLYWFDEAVNNNPSSALAYLIRAGFYLRIQDLNKALADINKAEQQDLSDSTVRLRLADELIDLDFPDRAEQHLEAIRQSDPANQNLWQLWAKLAIKSTSPEKMQQIAGAGLQELASQPWDFMPVATELFILAGQYDKAEANLSQLKQKNISLTGTTYLEGLLAFEKGEALEAVQHWQQSVKSGNNSMQTRLALASALNIIGDSQSALAQLQKLVSENPDSVEAHLALAQMLVQVGDWTDVQTQATRIIELDPDNTDAYLLLLQARLQLMGTDSTSINAQDIQNIEQQLSTFKQAAPDSIIVDLVQLQFEIRKGDFSSAEEILSQLKQDYPNEVRVALAEAELLYAQEKTDDLIANLNETVAEFPESIGAITYLASLLNIEDDKNGCEAVLKDAMARTEQGATKRELGLLLAQFYTQWNQPDDAFNLLDNLAKEMPNDIPIKRGLLLCQQVIQDSSKAQALIDEIKSLEGQNGWQWRYSQARLWFIDENFDRRYPQIISYLQENILANPDDKSSRLLLAMTYEKAGELQLAISTYKETLNRYPNDLRVITSTVAALYKANEYDEAEELLVLASRQQLPDPHLQQLQLQNYLRIGQLDSASDILQDLLDNDPNNQSICLSLALLKMQQDKYSESEKLITQLREQDPNSLSVIAAQVQLYLRQDETEQAIRLCNECVNKNKDATSYVLRAKTNLILNRSDACLADLEMAISAEPNNVSAWVARSDYYHSSNQLEKGLADIEQALLLTPDDLGIQKRTISLLLALNQPDKVSYAREIIEKAIEANPDDADLKLFEAGAFLIEGTTEAIENAKRILQQITRNQPELSRAWLLLGEILLEQDQSESALNMAMRGLTYNPRDAQLMMLKARAELAQSPILAIPTLKETYELDPNNINAAIYLARAYILADEPRKAVDLLRKHLSFCAEEDKRSCTTILAVALYRSGDKAAAKEQFTTLLESEPDNPGPFLTQAQLLINDQLWDELKILVFERFQEYPQESSTPVAIAGELLALESVNAKKVSEDILKMVLENDQDNVQAMNYLAILLHTTERISEAAELYQRVTTLDPNNIISINNLAWILSEEEGQYQQALELAQRGLSIYPDYVDLIDTRGVIYYHLGQFDKSVRDFAKAIELYSDSMSQAVVTRFHMARTLAELEQKEESLEYLNQSLQMHNQIGGLSDAELSEAQLLLKRLQEEN